MSRGFIHRRWVVVALGLLSVAGCGRRGEPEKPAIVEGTAIAPDGVRIAYDQRGSGDPALVFIHGWCGTRSHWRHQVDEFAKNHRVVTLDLAGHGASGSERSSWAIEALGVDVQTVVETLGLRRVVLIGHSLGGPVALVAAARMPGRVAGVIAVDTLHDAEFVLPNDAIETMAGRFEADFTGTMAQAVRSMFPAEVDQRLVDSVVTTAVGTSRVAAIAIMRDYKNLDLKKSLRSAGVPVRCINVPPRDEGGLETAIDRNRAYADFDAVILMGSGHYPMLDQPAVFNEKLRRWLEEIESR